MKKLLMASAVIFTALLSVSCAGSKPEAESTILKKVVFPGDYPDPSIVRDGNDFYMTHSSFTYYPGLLVWHSTDLVNWEPVARAVGMQNYSIFAPEICKVGDKFYIYYPTSAGENYVVMADTPRGPWSEPVKLAAGGIDPGHVYAENGKQYLYTNNCYAVELTDDGLAAVGEVFKPYDGWQFPEEWETEGFWLESPKLFKRGEYFYLVTAEGGTAGPPTSHMVVVARSKSAIGPWENMPSNPLVHTYSADDEWWSKGHGTIFDDAQGNWYIVYHAYRNGYHTLGRTTIIESIEWTEDGWPKLSNPENDYVEDDANSCQYAQLRATNPIMWADWAAGFEGNELKTMTAVDRAYEVTAEFEIAEGAKAGLYLWYNEEAHLGEQVSEPHCFMRIKNDKNLATVQTSFDGEIWTTIVENFDVSSYHHNNYGGFYALRPAVMLASGAKLLNFTYKVL